MLKLVSINIEQDKHHNTVLPFLEQEQPDIVCLQEVFEKDLSLYEKALNMKSFFRPMAYWKPPMSDTIIGTAILSKYQANFSYKYIVGDEKNIPKFSHVPNDTKKRNAINIVLLWADVKDQNESQYRVAATHFTWAPNGLSTEYQREDANKLISILDQQLKDFVLAGDLNSPRGRATFAMFASKYKDNIPEEYDSSIDPKLHRVPGLRYMVDGLFSTSAYSVKNVRLIEGISDHKAIVCNIELKK